MELSEIGGLDEADGFIVELIEVEHGFARLFALFVQKARVPTAKATKGRMSSSPFHVIIMYIRLGMQNMGAQPIHLSHFQSFIFRSSRFLIICIPILNSPPRAPSR